MLLGTPCGEPCAHSVLASCGTACPSCHGTEDQWSIQAQPQHQHHAYRNHTQHVHEPLLGWLAEALQVVVTVVSITRLSFSLSFTLVVSNMSLSHYLRVMTNNSRAVMNLLRCFLAVLCDNILTLLHISSVHHHIILLVTSLVIVSLASSV